MHRLFTIFASLLLVGCVSTGASVSVGTGGTFVSFNVRGDMLESAPGEAYAINREGLNAFLAGNYETAQFAFQETLTRYPDNPDAIYYLGLTRIYQGRRDEGFSLLSQYRDSRHIRVTQNVQWWAEYCRKKPELTPEKIQEVMNKARTEGYQQERREELEERGGFFR